jgi:hypothetical protein
VWTGFEVLTASGNRHRPGGVSVDLPPLKTGFCDNVDIQADAGDFRIVTGVRRHSPSTRKLTLSR